MSKGRLVLLENQGLKDVVASGIDLQKRSGNPVFFFFCYRPEPTVFKQRHRVRLHIRHWHPYSGSYGPAMRGQNIHNRRFPRAFPNGKKIDPVLGDEGFSHNGQYPCVGIVDDPGGRVAGNLYPEDILQREIAFRAEVEISA